MDDVYAECQRRLFIHGVDLGFFIMGVLPLGGGGGPMSEQGRAGRGCRPL